MFACVVELSKCDVLAKENVTTPIVSLWMDTKLQPARPSIMIEHLRMVIKEFNTCLQMYLLDMRRLRISSLIQKREESVIC
jgi:hypothetical protein